MDFYTLVKERFSVRKFKEQAVEKEKVDRILEAGRVAPTAKNLQPFHVYVLKSEEALKKIRELTPGDIPGTCRHAPLRRGGKSVG